MSFDPAKYEEYTAMNRNPAFKAITSMPEFQESLSQMKDEYTRWLVRTKVSKEFPDDILDVLMKAATDLADNVRKHVRVTATDTESYRSLRITTAKGTVHIKVTEL
jgi:hypothetical protein